MSYLVVFVLDNPNLSARLLKAWEQAGASGVTILESTGIGRLRKSGLMDDFSIMPSLRELMQSSEIDHRTFFSVVPGEQQVDDLIAATERVVGDLNNAHAGILFAIQLARVYGVETSAVDQDVEP